MTRSEAAAAAVAIGLACAGCVSVGDSLTSREPQRSRTEESGERSVVRDAPLPRATREPTPAPHTFRPAACGTVTISVADGPDCEAEELWSGAIEGQPLVGLLVMDTTSWPPGASALKARLVLNGADDDSRGKVGRFTVRMVDAPVSAALSGLNLDTVAALTAVPGRTSWRVNARELRAGVENGVQFNSDALTALSRRAGAGAVFFRIDGPRTGTNAFAWHARGDLGPRLEVTFDRSPTSAPPTEALLSWPTDNPSSPGDDGSVPDRTPATVTATP